MITKKNLISKSKVINVLNLKLFNNRLLQLTPDRILQLFYCITKFILIVSLKLSFHLKLFFLHIWTRLKILLISFELYR